MATLELTRQAHPALGTLLHAFRHQPPWLLPVDIPLIRELLSISLHYEE